MLNFANNLNWNFQPVASTTMEKIVDLHNDIMVFLIFIMVFMSWLLGSTIWLFSSSNSATLSFSFQHHTRIEQIWTIVPAFILLLMATPSFSLLYALDETEAVTPKMTLHVIGNQWYWAYDYPNLYKHPKLYEFEMVRESNCYWLPVAECSSKEYDSYSEMVTSEGAWDDITSKVMIMMNYMADEYYHPDMRCKSVYYPEHNDCILSELWCDVGFTVKKVKEIIPSTLENVRFESYMITEENLTFGGLRLLEVDNIVTLPINTPIRILVTSSDVLHSWAMPSLGIKMDACPGSINQVSLFITRKGMFYGQCSELCGVQHSFMPIAMKGVNSSEFFKTYFMK